MDFISSAILGGVLYDCFKVASTVNADFLKEKLKGWVFDDETLYELTNKVNDLNVSKFGENYIAEILESSQDIMSLLIKIKPIENMKNIPQVHYGSGDNVAGNKIVNNK